MSAIKFSFLIALGLAPTGAMAMDPIVSCQNLVAIEFNTSKDAAAVASESKWPEEVRARLAYQAIYVRLMEFFSTEIRKADAQFPDEIRRSLFNNRFRASSISMIAQQLDDFVDFLVSIQSQIDLRNSNLSEIRNLIVQAEKVMYSPRIQYSLRKLEASYFPERQRAAAGLKAAIFRAEQVFAVYAAPETFELSSSGKRRVSDIDVQKRFDRLNINDLDLGLPSVIKQVDAVLDRTLNLISRRDVELELSQGYLAKMNEDLKFLEEFIDNMYLQDSIVIRIAMSSPAQRQIARAAQNKIVQIQRLLSRAEGLQE